MVSLDIPIVHSLNGDFLFVFICPSGGGYWDFSSFIVCIQKLLRFAFAHAHIYIKKPHCGMGSIY